MKKLWLLCTALFAVICVWIGSNLPQAKSYIEKPSDKPSVHQIESATPAPAKTTQKVTELPSAPELNEPSSLESRAPSPESHAPSPEPADPLEGMFSDLGEDDEDIQELKAINLSASNPVFPANTGKHEPVDYNAAEDPEGSDTLPMLVNHQNTLDKSYRPTNLVYVGNTSYQLTIDCAKAFAELQSAAKAEGLKFSLRSAYRSYATQDYLYKKKVTAFSMTWELTEAQERAARIVARPGYSEHQTGLAADVGVLQQAYGKTKQGIWLAKHCWEYGFIIRYPEGKTDITGYIYEPWHIRYVGIEHAKIMHENNWCLEEYMEYRLTEGASDDSQTGETEASSETVTPAQESDGETDSEMAG